jgi:hypothetical protein
MVRQDAYITNANIIRKDVEETAITLRFMLNLQQNLIGCKTMLYSGKDIM